MNSRSAKSWPRNRTKYAYDANGNANSRQGSNITWSSYNYPTAIAAGSGSTAETVGLSYGPDRQRWQQSYTGNGTTETTDYIGGLLDFVASGGVLDYRHYIYAGGEAVAVYSRKNSGVNTWSYKLSDHQGGVTSFTNSSGASLVGESFTPFGSRRNVSTWSGPPPNSDLTTAAGISRQGYTFQTQLGLWMGMNHMNGRVQDSLTGRFLSADPTIPDPTNTQSYNHYSYVNNNPLSFVDPSGYADIAVTCKRTLYRGGRNKPPGGRTFVRPRMKDDPYTAIPVTVTTPTSSASYTIYQASPGYGFSTSNAFTNSGDKSAAFETPMLSITNIQQSSTPNQSVTPNASPPAGQLSPPSVYSTLTIDNNTGVITVGALPPGIDTLGGATVDAFGNKINNDVSGYIQNMADTTTLTEITDYSNNGSSGTPDSTAPSSSAPTPSSSAPSPSSSAPSPSSSAPTPSSSAPAPSSSDPNGGDPNSADTSGGDTSGGGPCG